MKKIALLMVVISALVVTGCGTETAKLAESSGAESAATEMSTELSSVSSETTVVTEAAPAVPAKTEFYIGELVEIGDVVLVLNGVKTTKGEGAFAAEEGNVYHVFDLSVYNNGTEGYNLSSLLSLEAQDSDAYTYTPELFYEPNGRLDGLVPSGMMVRGEAAFQVQESSELAFLTFDYAFWGSGQIRFDLSPDKAIEPVAYVMKTQPAPFGIINSPIDTSDFIITVNSAKKVIPGKYALLADGYAYLILDVTVENKTAEPQTFATMNFSQLSLDGRLDHMEYAPDLKGDVGGEYSPSSKKRGEVAFSVPVDSLATRVIYSDYNGYQVFEIQY